MKPTRIEVPLLPPPHFDDEATIATARQVVPIKGARIAWRRKTLALLPLLLASTLCGALGAVAVNYYERRRELATTATQQPALPNVSTLPKTEPSPVNVAPQLTANETEIQAAAAPTASPATSPDQPPTLAVVSSIAKRDEAEQPKSPSAAAKREAPLDAAKLVRKRRVQPPPEIAPKRKGASGIEDLFVGPNP